VTFSGNDAGWPAAAEAAAAAPAANLPATVDGAGAVTAAGGSRGRGSQEPLSDTASTECAEAVPTPRSRRPRNQSPGQRGKDPRSRCANLYADALARRERQRERRDTVERSEHIAIEEGQRDSLLQLREWQRTYRLQDTRTHEEREEALLRRRRQRQRETFAAQAERELTGLEECTFQPTVFRSKQGTVGSDLQRSSSCGASTGLLAGSASSVRQRAFVANEKLQIMLKKQLSLVRQLTELEEDRRTQQKLMDARCVEVLGVANPQNAWQAAGAAQARGVANGCRRPCQSSETAGAGAGEKCAWESPRDFLQRSARLALELQEEQQAAELRLYRRQLTIVHALERLDVQALSLSKEELEGMVHHMGFRLGLAASVRPTLELHMPASEGAADTGTPAWGNADPGSEPCLRNGTGRCSADAGMRAVHDGDSCTRKPLRDSVNSLRQQADDELMGSVSLK